MSVAGPEADLLIAVSGLAGVR